jgi:hypothetical protein
MRRYSFLGLVVVGLLLSGCATAGGDASNPTASTESSKRDASIKNTQVCVQNNTPMRMRIQWSGFPQPVGLGPGTQQCNSGSALLWDIDATLAYEPVDLPGTWNVLGFKATNHVFGPPEAIVWYEANDKQYGICAEFYEGDDKSLQVGVIRAYMSRRGDSENNKEFVLTVTSPKGADYAFDVSDCVNVKPSWT